MRLRGVAVLGVLTAGDYLLWDWSVAGSHDVLALASGLTLLPLAAVSAGALLLGAARVLTHGLRRSSRMARPLRASRDTHTSTHTGARTADPHLDPAASGDPRQTDRSGERLAA